MDEWCRNVRITSVITGLTLQRQLSPCFHKDLWQECFCNLVGERYKTALFPVHTVRAHLNMQEGGQRREPEANNQETLHLSWRTKWCRADLYSLSYDPVVPR